MIKTSRFAIGLIGVVLTACGASDPSDPAHQEQASSSDAFIATKGGGVSLPVYTATLNVIGDVSIVPASCHDVNGHNGYWAHSSPFPQLDVATQAVFCEMTWMGLANSVPDWLALWGAYPGAKFQHDDSCTGTSCGAATGGLYSTWDPGGGTGGLSCHACDSGTLVGRMINGVAYVTLPTSLVAPWPTYLTLYRPNFVGPVYVAYTAYVPATARSLSFGTGSTANGYLYVDTPGGTNATY